MTLSQSALVAHYDALGAGQDREMRYAAAAFDALVAAGDFGRARAVFEAGPGSGLLAARLLEGDLPPDATWQGVDLAPGMAAVTAERIAPFGPRAGVVVGDAIAALEDLPAGGVDRVVATYVLDTMTRDEIGRFLAAAARALTPGGLVCIAGLAKGQGARAWLTGIVWGLAWRLAPARVGGCRPVPMTALLGPGWRVCADRRVTAAGITSAVLVAARD